MTFLPLFHDLTRGHVVLAGAGAHALAKLRFLHARGASIRWYPMTGDGGPPPHVPEGIGMLKIADGEPAAHVLGDAIALIAASATEVDERLARRALKLRVPVNVVDRPDLSTFLFPAIVDRGEVMVAISTGGTAPVLARRLRERIEALLPARIGELAAFIGRWRKRLRARFGSAGASRQLWERFVDGPVGRSVLEGRSGEAEGWLAALSKWGAESHQLPLGSVALVGAGPGDPDLLTLKALRALQDADVVFYDELVTPEILDRIRRDAEKISVGKRKTKPGESQHSINHRMIAAAKAGSRVVRLKGGDPFIFGRGGEELEALRAAGIPVSVVPGVTAALGCAAEAELPLTFRDEATRVLFVTAHRAGEQGAADWAGMIDPYTTLVIYMGLASATAIRDGLIEAGCDPATPAAVLTRGTWTGSHSVAGVLADLPALAAGVGEGPALIVVGAVVARSRPWRRPLGDVGAPITEAA